MKLNDRYPMYTISENDFEVFSKDTYDNRHFRISTLKEFNCKWNLVYSSRDDGKSTGVCEELLYQRFVNGKNVLYLRRYPDEVKNYQVKKYFREKCFLKMLNLIMKRRCPNFEDFFIDVETGEMLVCGYPIGKMESEVVDHFGYFTSLKKYVDKKSGQYDNVYPIVYEEFLSRDKPELDGEFEVLLNTISTYCRDEPFEFFGVGNTVNRRSSIFDGFSINPDDIPIGIVQTFKYIDANKRENTLAVYHAPESEAKLENSDSFYFGEKKKTNVVGTDWYIEDFPTIPEDFTEINKTPELAIAIFDGQIKLFLYFIENKIVCSQRRIYHNVEKYLTLCGETNPNRGWLSIGTHKRLIDIIKFFSASNWIYYDDNYAGDDLQIFLQNH